MLKVSLGRDKYRSGGITLHETRGKMCHKNDVTLKLTAVIDPGLLSLFIAWIMLHILCLPAASGSVIIWHGGLLTWPICLRHHSLWLMPRFVVTIYQFSLSQAPPLAPFLSPLCSCVSHDLKIHYYTHRHTHTHSPLLLLLIWAKQKGKTQN